MSDFWTFTKKRIAAYGGAALAVLGGIGGGGAIVGYSLHDDDGKQPYTEPDNDAVVILPDGYMFPDNATTCEDGRYDTGAADPDGDGFNNTVEIKEGTNPLDPNSYPGSGVVEPPEITKLYFLRQGMLVDSNGYKQLDLAGFSKEELLNLTKGNSLANSFVNVRNLNDFTIGYVMKDTENIEVTLTDKNNPTDKITMTAEANSLFTEFYGASELSIIPDYVAAGDLITERLGPGAIEYLSEKFDMDDVFQKAVMFENKNKEGGRVVLTRDNGTQILLNLAESEYREFLDSWDGLEGNHEYQPYRDLYKSVQDNIISSAEAMDMRSIELNDMLKELEERGLSADVTREQLEVFKERYNGVNDTLYNQLRVIGNKWDQLGIEEGKFLNLDGGPIFIGRRAVDLNDDGTPDMMEIGYRTETDPNMYYLFISSDE